MELHMSTLNIMKYMRENQAPTTPKADKVANPNRITSADGRFFLQPTGGKNGSAFKFHYCYIGFKSKAGEFISGVSMDNLKMLQLIEEKILPKDLLAVFDAYAEHHADHEVIKTA